ncbi:hypothetical protein SAMN05192553_11223 [Cyclobacterium xiamenense]|uniref:Uncharacterized protein n=1 Tax=Cyclobacterium xiamenense TaxID=1297121 RepID=A0A1H7BH65_9BACT|nr:hypothetical protein [Cyclobacterium xiamenense]SEJ76971.1 hypothetical protein SAMN05192553_11223 [Cyclobacterium xiamenense]
MSKRAPCKEMGPLLLGCNTQDPNPKPQGEVTLSSPTIEPDGSLSLNATAGFEAAISGLESNPSLVYEWSLAAGRGTLIVDNQEKGRSWRVPRLDQKGNSCIFWSAWRIPNKPWTPEQGNWSG